MSVQTLEGHLGISIAVDLCVPCQAFWFDHRESLQLTPRSTLQLFRVIGEEVGVRRRALSATAKCPRCGSRLVPTHDMQRNVGFEYARCSHGHGRLTTFFDFLREKNFIRPLSADQIDALRTNVQTVNCSNCGAPIDLAAHSACSHCGSPISMLDLRQTQELITRLQQSDRPDRPIDPALPMRLEQARREVETAFAAFEHEPTWFDSVSTTGLVSAGISSLARWLKGRA
jgi:ribosomal protein S27AE